MTGFLIKGRSQWIDAARALAIVLVVFGHCCPGQYWFTLLAGPIKMPLFFVISGFLFRDDGLPCKAFGEKQFWNLIVPWFCIGLITPLLLIPQKGVSYFLHCIVLMLEGRVLWFMPCFIIGLTIHYLIRKYSKSFTYVVVISLVVSCAGAILAKLKLFEIAKINTALLVQVFFLIGLLFKHYCVVLETYVAKTRVGILIASSLYLLLAIIPAIVFPGKTIDVHNNVYYDLPFSFLLICFGCITVLLVSKRMGSFPSWWIYIGQNTLVIYLINELAIALFNRVLGGGIENPLFEGCVRFIWTMLFCILFSLLVNKYCPVLLGRRNHHVGKTE